MQSPEMGHHGPVHQLHTWFQTWDAAPEVLPVGGTITSSPLIKIPLWHPYANFPRLAGHGLVLCNIEATTVPVIWWGYHLRNMPKLLLNAVLILSWTFDSSSTVSYNQYLTTLYTVTFKSVGDTSTPCVVPLVAWNYRRWLPFWRLPTSWRDAITCVY